MAAYPESIKFEIYTSSWVDISSYVVLDTDIRYGLQGNSQVDRVSSTGTMNLTLNNADGKFSPDRPTAITGFRKGIPLKLTVTYGNEDFTKFYGHIQDIQLDSGSWGDRQVNVTVADWMDYAGSQPLSLNTVLYNKRIDEAVDTIVTAMPIQPLKITYYPGTDTFPTVFDNSKSNTKALSEFQKLALSEFGYIYLRKDKVTGENLVVEGRHNRKSTSTATKIPISSFNSGNLLQETESLLLQENGDTLLIDELQTISFDNNMTSLGVKYGDNLSNYIVVRTYPRRIDETTQVLYSLSSPIKLSAGETKENIKVSYRDPGQLATKVSGMDMITPVATTDYEMRGSEYGTGTILTSYLEITVTFGANEALLTLTNTGTMAGYVTKLNLRGIGIYTYESLDFIAEDTTSINSYGYSELSLDQKYQADGYVSQGLAQVVLAEDKDPRITLYKVNFLANTSDELMQTYLFIDVGDLVYLKETQTGVDGYFYINGLESKINQGGIITFSWLVSEAKTLERLYWELGITGKTELGTNTILGF